LASVLAPVGTVVKAGQVLARIDRPQLTEQITNAQTQLAEFRRQHEQLTEFTSKDSLREIDLIAHKRANQERMIKDLQEQVTWLEEKLTNQNRLLERGLITKQTLLTTKQNFYSVQQQIDTARGDLKDLANREFQFKNQNEKDVLASQIKINEAERRVRELESELSVTTTLVSPREGRVIEVAAKPGDLLATGTSIFNLEAEGSDLEAVMYLNASDGKRVSPGMTIQIAPGSYRVEEHGYMIGKVKFVADYPATRQSMMSVLENEQLVQRLSGSDAPITLYATIVKDPKTPSGFRWSSSQGPPNQIHSGTLCSANIVVAEQRPITLVIPALRGFLGI
ncbi:MAG TPA: NHLP bacteriocin system secretion protein, partial [Verrucomicrobiae bacterium]|nr:NHLP bacteriocin system secretion protein [Verrucomicrobiae bacterium]